MIMMDEYLQFFFSIAAAFLVLICILIRINPDMVPINWPIVGMLPHLLFNVHRIHDYGISILCQIKGSSFHFKGPWLSSMDILFTVDPENIHHVMSKNFANFPKGEKFADMFDILGDGIFSADFELWKHQRRVTHSFLTHPRFNRFLLETVRLKTEEGLLPIIEGACRDGETVDLEDLFGRLTFDTICCLVTGFDMKCLSAELPDIPFCKALDDAEEVIFYRHVIPESIWKVMRWFGIGMEKKMKKAWESLDEFIYKCLDLKKEEMKKIKKEEEEEDEGVDLLTLYMEGSNEEDFRYSDKFLRDMFLNLLIAGRDTTSSALTWFFWLLHNNPEVESKIKEEIQSLTSKRDEKDRYALRSEDMSKLVYLHGALCETLRLYPPVPMQHKCPIKPDVLPSGHHVTPNTTKIIFDLYVMGRMKSLWGDDCLEFKPERWITERGNNKHEPSYKFLSFNAGPRTCLGKDMAFTQMKAVVFSVLVRGYKLEVVNADEVEVELSIILHTKRGLKVKVCRE